MGVSATVAGEPVIVGSRKLLEREAVATGGIEALTATLPVRRSVVYVAVGGRLAGALALHDPVRTEARAAIGELRRAGHQVVLLSGDASGAARAAADEAGIDEVEAELRPDEKKHALARLRRPGSAVAAVGDAVDDAPVLAAADVGIALGRGADLVLEAGSINVVRGDLEGVSSALALARRTVGAMRLCLAWALVYNLGMVIAVAAWPLGWAAPAVAAVGAAASTGVVVSMSLRLRRA
jgi:P-type E1-E2 ATPase